MEVKGYKVFNPDWTCSPHGNTKQYVCPGLFEEDVTPIGCVQGMHFCRKAIDCFNYYSFSPDNKVAEVVAYGDIAEENDKCCTNKLKIVREIPWGELLDMVNTGKGCTGERNSGDWNSGNYNSGDYNSGDWNSGNWNRCSFSNGCFNTVTPTIYLFNKPSKWSYYDWKNSNAYYILRRMPDRYLKWVLWDDMTDEEKERHPESKNTGGYLKTVCVSNRMDWWHGLNSSKKNAILSIPNFDKKIFKEITGIDVEE